MTIAGHGLVTTGRETTPIPAPTDELTPADVADLLKIDIGRVYTMAQQGRLPAIDRPGPCLRFSRKALIDWLHQK